MKTLLAISFVLLVGAAGVTVAAAQGSQPGEPIYAIKAWTEQAHTFLQTRTQVRAAQVTGQSAQEAGVAEPDRIQLQTRDMQQDQDRIQPQTQDQLQTRERDRIQLQTQDMLQTQEQLQTQERVQQSPGSGQQSQVGDGYGQGNYGAGLPHPQDHARNGPNSVDGNQP